MANQQRSLPLEGAAGAARTSRDLAHLQRRESALACLSVSLAKRPSPAAMTARPFLLRSRRYCQRRYRRAPRVRARVERYGNGFPGPFHARLVS
jgi:hypothetical protein